MVLTVEGMYSEKLEEVISAALQDGKLTPMKRRIIKRRAEKEGEDVEEVMMVVDARLQQSESLVGDSNDMLIDNVTLVTESQYNELEKYRKEGYSVFQVSNCIGVMVTIMNEYNTNAEKWGFAEMLWSDSLSDANVLYIKEQPELKGKKSFNATRITEVVRLRASYLQAFYDIVSRICEPFEYRKVTIDGL